MSYCRFSDYDFQCDVYCYEHVGGLFVTHVAGIRYVYDSPLPDRVPLTKDDGSVNAAAWLERADIVRKMIDRSERVPIGLPHDGETFEDATAAEAADRLEYLRALGYNVPDYAIAALREEAALEG